MAKKIDHGWWTECSACGGNADPDDTSHVKGGPDKGGPMGPRNDRSALSENNGCRAPFEN